MKLPNVEQAYVPRSKVVDYLLSERHPDGRGKATFFVRFGFSVETWHEFERGLLQHAKDNEVAATAQMNYGKLYTVEGDFPTPIGRTVGLRSVWIVETDSTSQRFVTAYPL